MNEIALYLLEHFEIIYRVRTANEVASADKIHAEQMFFIPSLLALIPDEVHPARKYWKEIDCKYECTYILWYILTMMYRALQTRIFKWSFFPAGFFPQLLLRLVHLRVRFLGCWLNGAVVMSRAGTECALLKLSHSPNEDNQYLLEVR